MTLTNNLVKKSFVIKFFDGTEIFDLKIFFFKQDVIVILFFSTEHV